MKTNEQAKQEAIKQAYGEHWDMFKHFTDKNGWITELVTSIHHGINEDCRTLRKYIDDANINFFERNNRIIPSSILNIWDNNGWTRIEPDGSNLPVSGRFKVCKLLILNTKNWYVSPDEIEADDFQEYVNELKFTHYKPIIDEPKPIY